MPIHHKQIRLKHFDYSSPGAYYVTIVVNGREPALGLIESGKVKLSEIGRIVDEAWMRLGETYSYVEIDQYVIMPNHFHGLLFIQDTGEKRLPLGRLVGAFKTLSTRDINKLRSTPGQKFWQDEFYDHVIRGDEDLRLKREYIMNNPLRWDDDEENPDCRK